MFGFARRKDWNNPCLVRWVIATCARLQTSRSLALLLTKQNTRGLRMIWRIRAKTRAIILLPSHMKKEFIYYVTAACENNVVIRVTAWPYLGLVVGTHYISVITGREHGCHSGYPWNMFPKRQYCVDDRRTVKKRDDQSSVAHTATALWNHSTTVYTYTKTADMLSALYCFQLPTSASLFAPRPGA